ncbi:probable 1,3-beta-glucanosyltransferase Gas3p [Trichomonascus vanleenenianus]|uniref:putative 1,3-beta-glucanosyltransferase n=1 Tax=Trichomonascus vanleenenianus TaxID=2268995 RepID=UPI003ECA6732
MKFSSAIAALAATGSLVSALIPIEVKGSRFVRPAIDANDEGDEFTVIGIDYQPGGSASYSDSSGTDVLSDGDVCLRDAFVLQQLGVNTIRVYTINPWINHDECMSIFNAVGIYVILDVNSPLAGESLSRTDPGSSYNKGYLNRVFGVIDAFKGYPNLLGFFSGNEVVNDAASAAVVPKYIRAVQRDMKQYIAKHANRTIPVGYSAADDDVLREAMWMYLQCGDDESKSDFYGLNSYQWCTGDNWQTSGYNTLESTFDGTSIPVFLSEYGCNKVSPRTFPEVYQGIYGPLNQVFSGGLVYEYSQETSNYGLVNIQDDGSIKLLTDFDNLQKAYNKISLNQTSAGQIKAVTPATCNANSLEKVSSSFETTMDLPGCPAKSMLTNGGGNNNVGKIVKVTNTTSKYKIYNSSGKQIVDTSIEIDKDNEVNSPSGNNINTQSASPSSASSSTSTHKSKGSAVNVNASGFLAGLAAFLAMLI